MGETSISSGSHRSVAPEAPGNALSERTRRVLVETLYARPTALMFGALNGVLASAVVAFLTDKPAFYSLAFLLSSIAILRVINANHLRHHPGDISMGRIEAAYTIGAHAYAFVLGAIAAATVHLGLPPLAQILMTANAIGYGIGVCAHNGARPRLALTQLTLVMIPVFGAMVATGSWMGAFMAINMVLLFPAMQAVTSSIFRTLRHSIEAAEESAALAGEMERLALTDHVTGLYNRAGLDRRLVDLIALADERSQLAVFWVDLDRFKEVNDLKGHQAGDKVLRETGKRLSRLVDARGVVARFAGDEFVVVAPVAERRTAERLSEHMLAELIRPMRIGGERIEMGGSIGIALMPDDGVAAETLLKRADLALFEAKADGSRQIRFFDHSMTRNIARKREIESELRRALRENELAVYFQPIVELETGHIRCFEALVRWFHPERGEISPDEFIPIAEETGAIVTLGNWLTAQAASVATTWPEHVRVAVNLSPLQLKVPGAALGIVNALREAGLPPERLELEITENLFLEDSPNIGLFIEELSGIGVRFALDDFGTGYSSLGYINRWPFSKIKVDRSFVSGAQAGRKSEAIIRAVSQMGQSLGMEIVAEGLETIDQVLAVRDAGCTHGQGYHFSRAVPAYQAALLLAEERDIAPEELLRSRAG